MSEIVECIARAIREGRQCGTSEEPLMVPCPFCSRGPDDMTSERDETGCLWIANNVLKALVENGNLVVTPDAQGVVHECERCGLVTFAKKADPNPDHTSIWPDVGAEEPSGVQ